MYLHTYIHTYIQTERQRDKQTDRETNRETDRQIKNESVKGVHHKGLLHRLESSPVINHPLLVRGEGVVMVCEYMECGI